jgi:NADH dehydrogenase FAD-containing subunit
MQLNSKIPEGPLADKWSNHKFNMKLVNPANRRKYSVIVVGSGLAGASAAASLAEQGYNVSCFCYQTVRVVLTVLLRRGGSTLPRITKTTEMASTAYFTTLSKGATTARGRPMCIVWPRSVS